MNETRRGRFRIGLDIGGTFTDLAVYDGRDGQFCQFKSLTTDDPLECAPNCLGKAAEHFGLSLQALLAEVDLFCFGSTIGLNTLLTASGARVGIITTRGHGDAYRIAEMNRAGIVDVREAVRQTFTPLISRRLVVEVAERTDYTGAEVVPLDESALASALQHLVETCGVEALVISFLWAQRNPAHEQRALALARARYPQLFITLGSDISGSLGEFKRTATAVINAYIGEAVNRQGTRLKSYLVDQGLRVPLLVMQTLGGVAPLKEIIRAPVMLLNSGPAGGAVGALAVAKDLAQRNVVCMDVGGTSCDISAITEQEVALNAGLVVLGHPIAVSGVEIESIGAGGGSIATLERAGGVARLRVGPESAGSRPGPACYGRGGTRPTVTDANLVLGLLDPARPLGGEIELDEAAARTAILAHASRTGRAEDVVDDAWGIYRVITATMADAIESFLVTKGYDPRQYALVAFGAAGGLHAAAIGDRLRIPLVVVPNFFPIFSAFGLMTTDIRHAYSLTDDSVKLPLGAGLQSALDDHAASVSARLREVARMPMQLLEEERVPVARRAVQLFLDLRYTGQVLELGVAVPDTALERDLRGGELGALVEEWLAKYRRVYGEGAAWSEGTLEIINYRAVGVGRIDSPPSPTLAPARQEVPSQCARRRLFLGRWLDAEIWDDSCVHPGLEITGPALLVGELRTVLIGPADRARVDSAGHLLISPGGGWGWRGDSLEA